MGVPLLGKRMIDCRTVACYSCSNVCSTLQKMSVHDCFFLLLYILFTPIYCFLHTKCTFARVIKT